MNLQCSAQQSGKTVPVKNTKREDVPGANLDCGDSIPDRIPYFVMLALMIGTTYYSSRQTQRATPQASQNSQTQIITRVMPLMFGVFGFAFPAGLVLYWTVSNGFQIGQQVVMLRLGHIGPQAMDRRLEQAKTKSADKPEKARTGFMGKMLERADQERKRRLGEPQPPRKPPPRTSGSGGSQSGTAKGGSSGRSGTGKASGAGGSGRRKKGGSGPRRKGPNRPKGSGR
jgi:YidC/Oxa1 family membrane protein insertase